MTHRGTLIIALFILATIGLSVLLFGSDHLVFLGKKFAELLEYLAFWR